MLMYVVYRPSREFPHSWVVRRWKATAKRKEIVLQLIDTGLPLVIAPSKEDARTVIPMGELVRITRDPEDDPAVEETWF